MNPLQPGDIILLKRPKRSWYGYALNLFVEIFNFFIRKQGLVEMVDRYYHIEMVYDEERSVTEQPPRVHIHKIPKYIKVFRASHFPSVVALTRLFNTYVEERMGLPFDFRAFWMRMFDGILGTHWFSNRYTSGAADMCAEFVSRFYASLGYPCIDSEHTPDNVIPGNVNDYCSKHPDLWEVVRDDE